MLRRRYEILLPLRYKEGTPLEPLKFLQTQEELIARFGAVTTSPEPLRGVWIDGENRFEDEHLRLIVDVEPSDENR
jgi:hypothetical protein